MFGLRERETRKEKNEKCQASIMPNTLPPIQGERAGSKEQRIESERDREEKSEEEREGGRERWRCKGKNRIISTIMCSNV